MKPAIQLPRPILERLSFSQLFAYSEPKRVVRALTVRGPPLKIKAAEDSLYYIFNFKSFPSTTGLRHHGYIKFYRPGRNKALKDTECILDCSCFAGDTLVLMGDGVYKPISEIREGDSVYTHKGRIRRVTGNVERQVKPSENVYSLRVAGFPLPITVTGNHPFYAFRQNTTCKCGCGEPLEFQKKFNPVRLGKYGLGHSTISNIIHGITKVKVNGPNEADFQWVKVDDFREKEWLLTPWLEEGSGTMDPDLARLLGYYAAEGCLSQSGMHFSLHIDEEDTLGKDISEIIHKLAGHGFREPRPYRGKQGGMVRIGYANLAHYARPMQAFQLSAYTTYEFAEFIKENIGEGSHNKRLSPFMMDLNNEALKQIVIGMFLGDGHTNKMGHFRWSSVSRNLVWNVSTILNRLKIRHVITNCETTWSVDVNCAESARTLHSWLIPYLRDHVTIRVCERATQETYIRDEGYLRVMANNQKIEYTGTVWDLSVEDDESFIVHGVAVHNCPDYKYRWSWVNKQRGSSQVGPESLNKAWNRAPRITNPTSRPGLCKHLLALKDYLENSMADQVFPSVVSGGSGQEAVDKEMRRLLAYSNNRWINTDGRPDQALDTEAELRATAQARNRGQLPTNAPAEPPDAHAVPAPSKSNDNPDNPANPSNESRVDSIERMNELSTARKLIEELEDSIQQGATPEPEGSEAIELLRSINAGIQRLAQAEQQPAQPELEPELEPEGDAEGAPDVTQPRPHRQLGRRGRVETPQLPSRDELEDGNEEQGPQ